MVGEGSRGHDSGPHDRGPVLKMVQSCVASHVPAISLCSLEGNTTSILVSHEVKWSVGGGAHGFLERNSQSCFPALQGFHLASGAI
jgi:hypothetical protein